MCSVLQAPNCIGMVCGLPQHRRLVFGHFFDKYDLQDFGQEKAATGREQEQETRWIMRREERKTTKHGHKHVGTPCVWAGLR